MTRVGRVRTRTSGAYSGSLKRRKRSGGTETLIGTYIGSHTNKCSDSVGRPVVPSALTVTKYTDNVFINGEMEEKVGSDPWIYKYDKYPIFVGLGLAPSELPLTKPDGWLLDLIAGTNPSRPMLAPPTMLQDLITLPALIRETGSLLTKPKKLWSPREAANGYLAAKFGWFPLIEDLQKLMHLQEYVIKRSRELDQLYSGRGLRRRLKFGDDTASGSYTTSRSDTTNLSWTLNMDKKVVRKHWGTIHWRPTSHPPYHQSDWSKHLFVRRLLLGLTVEGMAKGLWDVIPWTWLLGWFTNVGKYTLLHSNTVPAAWYGACYMSSVEYTYQPSTLTILKGKSTLSVSGKRHYSLKTRELGSGAVLPGFNMPLWDMSRLSILGALFAQRFMR